jgi:phosphotransferase system enzyme I (PtsI)
VQILKGLGVSSGLAKGRALRFVRNALELRVHLADEEVEREVARLQAALERSCDQLQKIRKKVERTVGPDPAGVFDAQLLMLDDPMLTPRAAALIRTERINADWALERVFEELADVFAATDDPIVRERRSDIADVVGRLRANLKDRAASRSDRFKQFGGPYVLIADELAPSVAAQIDWGQITGFATDAGSWTYHTAILARSLNVPAVVALHDATRRIPAGSWIAVDGTTGEVYVDPTPDRLAALETRAQEARRSPEDLPRGEPVPAVTRDGVPIVLAANVELGLDLEAALDAGAEGIGLYRSEYLLAEGPLDALTEDVQFEAYKALVQGMAPQPVTIRTFDLVEEQVTDPNTPEPSLAAARFGLRGLRLSLAYPDLFRTQIRALVRASRFGTLRVLFPFVTAAWEVERARAVVDEVCAQLGTPGLPVPAPEIGVMIEVPSAVLAADLLARHATFFAVGTNDLVQYCLAADRTDERLAAHYTPLDVAVLRAIRLVARVARRRGLPLSVCGEVAADPVALGALIGLGVTSFSMAPAAIRQARRAIQQLDTVEMRLEVGRILRGESPTAIAEDIRRQLAQQESGVPGA